MIRFRETIREARIPGILGRACLDNINLQKARAADQAAHEHASKRAFPAQLKGVREKGVFDRMVDVMLELGFAGQDCDAAMLRLRRFTDAEITRHGEAAAREATKRAVRRVDGAPASEAKPKLKGGAN